MAPFNETHALARPFFKLLATVIEGDQMAFFSIATTGLGEGATPFPRLLNFTLDTYLILLSVKQVPF